MAFQHEFQELDHCIHLMWGQVDHSFGEFGVVQGSRMKHMGSLFRREDPKIPIKEYYQIAWAGQLGDITASNHWRPTEIRVSGPPYLNPSHICHKGIL